jgi:CelD/BcsL family acetyltransferase involved in cellulose biosynthesis
MTVFSPTLLGRAAPAVTLAPERSAARWDELVAAHGGSFFHRHAFLTTIGAGLGLRVDLRAAVADGRPVGVVPLLVKRLGPVTTVNWVPFPYAGPLVPAGNLAATLAALRQLERRRACVRSQHVLPGLYEGATGGPDGGSLARYTASVDRTFVIPLEGRSDDELLQGMSSRRRASMRRAERNGVIVRTATRREVLDVMPRLSGRTFEQQGLPDPYPASCLRAVWDGLRDNPDVLWQAAEVSGRLVAVQVSLAGAPTGLGWIVGREQDQDGSDAFATMLWHTLRWARDRGCTEFDLVGAPTEGIANYKRGLGGVERRYTVFRRQARAHRTAVRLLQRLPGSRAE